MATYVIGGVSDPVMATSGDPPPDAGVQVEGVGTATGTPDVLRVTVGVETTGSTVGKALESASTTAGPDRRPVRLNLQDLPGSSAWRSPP